MLNQVSWAAYWTVLVTLTMAYYLLVFLLYFRNDALQLLTRQGKLLPAAEADSETPSSSSTNEQVQFDKVQILMGELKPLFEKNYVKEELLMALQSKLKAFPQLKGSVFEVAINNFIEMECENKCSVYLSEYELKSLWVR